MITTYSRRWNFYQPGPIDPISADEARARDASGELYTVTLGDPAKPDVVIEVERKNRHLGVYFFDKLGRRMTHYVFDQLDQETLFLESVIGWLYPNDEARRLNESSRIDRINYERGGIVHHELRDKAANEIRRTDYREVNLETNYEPNPQFGDWASLARFDRSSPSAGNDAASIE